MLSILGQAIRQLREENGISQEELAERIGIEVSRLDRIENSQATPSLGVLIRVSRALGPRKGSLVEEKEDYEAVLFRKSEEGETFEESGHLRFCALAGSKIDRHMEPMVIEVAPKSTEQLDTFAEHEGEETLYVLEGSITLFYGEQVYQLEQGDNIYYNSVVPHFLANDTDKTARVLITLYTPY